MNKSWTEFEKAFILAHPDMKDADLARILKKTLHATRKFRARMGVKKSGGRPRDLD